MVNLKAIPKIQNIALVLFAHIFYKNIVYKNIQAKIGQKIKNILRISSASVLAVVLCYFVFLSKVFLINRTLLI